ncbi:MAG: hypothetical protein AAF078_02625, partial [Planctomycetota bacterium]
KRRKAEAASRVMGILFLRVPFVNPDRFLDATMPLARWLFTMPGFVLWLLVTLAAGCVAIVRWEDLAAPALAIFEGEGLLTLWACLIGLKVLHEFGHAYACKAFGGHVPEMGAYFMLFTPLAYVDATDSWSFPKVRERSIVTLGGVYVESLVGGVALIVWAMTEPSALNSLAYQIALLATVTTALFNLNPLLRYDAYYLVSDLSGVPNLRARCQDAIGRVLKRVLYGVGGGEPWDASPGLLGFGAAQLVYRVFIMTALMSILAITFGTAGLALAVGFIVMTLAKPVLNLVRYLSTSDELATRRKRAWWVTGTLAAGAVVLTLLVPVRWSTPAYGVVLYEDGRAVAAPHDGTIVSDLPSVGEELDAGATVVVLGNAALETELNVTRARLEHSRRQRLAAAGESLSETLQARPQEALAAEAARVAADDVASLRVTLDEPATVTGLVGRRKGDFVRRGEPIVRVASGPLRVSFLIPATDAQGLRLEPGDAVKLHAPARQTTGIDGRVVDMVDLGLRQLTERELEYARQLRVYTDPATGRTLVAHYRVVVDLAADASLPPSSSVEARFPTEGLTLGGLIRRGVARMMNQLYRDLNQ